ncbi:hypothetical protein AB0F91_39705 [Amycolatopsis sp. NPDC023774]|uniref:hypothetical protein n=1 Tax=Amycolatopsis sp. NPDC023774 TaxID=3155015 RepID=UPI0033FA52DB
MPADEIVGVPIYARALEHSRWGRHMSEPWGSSQSDAKEARTYREILEDPFLDGQEKTRTMAESTVAHAVTLLLQRGDRDTAALVLDVEAIKVEYDDQNEEWEIWLEVAPEHYPRFTREWTETFSDVCKEISRRMGYYEFYLAVRETLPEVGPSWRDQLQDQLTSTRRPTNQARRARAEPPRFSQDYLAFTNQGEQTVYRALRQIQEQDLPSDETIGIYPLAGGRVPGKTWEPDFLVTYRGRAGVLEVDGPHHNARRALDTTREHLLRDAGIAFVDRIMAEAVENSAELNAVLRRFLRRLRETA